MKSIGERGRIVAALVALWAGSALLQATVLAAQEPIAFAEALFHFALDQAPVPLLAILVWRLADAVEGRSWPLAVAVHLGAAVVLIALWEGVSYALLDARTGRAADIYHYKGLWMTLNTTLQYGLLAAAVVAVRASRRLEVQRRRAAELLLHAREAEVRALKAQLRPHFLFNVLNSVYSLVPSRPTEAQEMIALLSDLLRRTLEVGDDPFVPLEWELSTTEAYLGIERIRLRERLEVRVDRDGADPQTLVPPLVLQPLVENAIKHGVARAVAGGTVTVSARRDLDVLELVVRNAVSADAPERPTHDGGRGLALTRARLAAAYGDAFQMDVCPTPGAFEVRLRIPIPASDGR